MGADVGAKTIAAEQNVAAEQGIAFSFEEKAAGQTGDFIAALGEPFFEMSFLALALFAAQPTVSQNVSYR